MVNDKLEPGRRSIHFTPIINDEVSNDTLNISYCIHLPNCARICVSFTVYLPSIIVIVRKNAEKWNNIVRKGLYKICIPKIDSQEKTTRSY